jgi:hypothetical protein
MTRTTRLLLLATMPTLAACPSQKPSDIGPWLLCNSTETVFAFDEETPLGISGADVLAGLAGDQTATGAYVEDDAGSTGVTVSAQSDATEVTFIERTPNASSNSDTGFVNTDCPDSIQFDATLSFGTDDGLFAESFTGTLSENDLQVVQFDGDVELSNLQGTFTADTSGSDETVLQLSNTFGEPLTGALSLVTAGTTEDDGGANSAVSWQSTEQILTWPAEDAE